MFIKDSSRKVNPLFIGNKPRHGSSNSSFSVIKGNQLGIKMKAGGKPVQLLKLDFGIQNNDQENLKFKVNVYEFNGILSGENFVKQDITGVIPKGKGRVSVDLEPYHIQVKKDLLVTIEWLETISGANPSFAMVCLMVDLISMKKANGKEFLSQDLILISS